MRPQCPPAVPECVPAPGPYTTSSEDGEAAAFRSVSVSPAGALGTRPFVLAQVASRSGAEHRRAPSPEDASLAPPLRSTAFCTLAYQRNTEKAGKFRPEPISSLEIVAVTESTEEHHRAHLSQS